MSGKRSTSKPGKRPFTGPTETAIYRAIDKGPKPLIEVQSGIPQAASDVVSRTLNSDPSQRYKTCREFASAFAAGLQPTSGDEPVVTEPVSKDVEPDSESGTRELDLEAYRKNRETEQQASGHGSGQKSGLNIADSIRNGPAVPKADSGKSGSFKGKFLRLAAGAAAIGTLLVGLFLSGTFERTQPAIRFLIFLKNPGRSGPHVHCPL